MHNRRKNQIPRTDILDLGDYERRRDAIRPKAIAARGVRRLDLGPNATIAFENRETVAYQIHEMLRAERIARENDVQHEIETYSDLLPASDELSATLMFEFPEIEGRNVYLRDLAGFENHLRLDFGAAGSSPAFFDRRQIDADKISAVQFVRFPVNSAQRAALTRATNIRVLSDHPRYGFAATLSAETCRALASDLEEAQWMEAHDV